MSKYLGPGASKEELREEGKASFESGISIAQFNSAVIDPKFWACTHMVFYVSKGLSDLEAWATTCPCHPDLDVEQTSCVMKGCRAPELAAGRLQEEYARLTSMHYSDLLVHVQGLAEADKAAILQDYQAAVNHYTYVLRIKCSHWERLPLKLCGLAHGGPKIAQHICQ